MSTTRSFGPGDLAVMVNHRLPLITGETVVVREIGHATRNQRRYLVADPANPERAAWVYPGDLAPPMIALFDRGAS